jgi:hypothetical protein
MGTTAIMAATQHAGHVEKLRRIWRASTLRQRHRTLIYRGIGSIRSKATSKAFGR